MSEKVLISRAHRDALYNELLLSLSEVNQLREMGYWEDPERIERCYRIGRRAIDALQLIQEGGLGWGMPPGRDPVELSLPAEQLRRIADELRSDLASGVEMAEADRAELEAEWRASEEVRDACTSILDQLDEEMPAHE